MRTWGTRPPGSTRARALPGWCRRWGWIMRASCWASRCPGWPGRAGSGISCWSCARCREHCRATRTASMTRPSIMTGCCSGLKGTLSEAELHLIRQRMWSGRIARARRGELAIPLPAGFARRPSGEVVPDPDEQVRSVVRLVFDLFDRLGTVGAVLAFLAGNRIQLGIRLREGPERGELAWRRPSRASVTNMLHNPAYAGIYAYGRSTLDPRRRQAGRPFTGRVRQPRGQWAVFLPGVLPAYISIEQYERNMARMDANRSRAGSLGAVRDGPALLAGLVACGRCGKKMTVRYQRGPGGKLHPAYVCDRDKSDYAADQCQQLAGPGVDAHVTGVLLAAMAPAALEVSLAL